MKRKLLTIMLACVLLLCGCDSKTPVDSETFVSVAEEQGFTVDKGESADEKIIEAYGAVKSGVMVQFYITEDSNHAKALFNSSKTLYEEQESVKVMSTEINLGNYHYCSFTGEDKFYILSAVENTYVSCVTDKDNKEEAVKLFEAIGYK